MTQPDEDPDVMIARLLDRTFANIDDRLKALAIIEHLISGAHVIARVVMEEAEADSFCEHLDSALSVLDDMD